MEIGFSPMLQWLNNRGYAVLMPNFRGSPGFGKGFHNARMMQWGLAMHRDVLEQVEWAIRQGIADRSRIAIMGGSYGGYETLVGASFSPEVFAAAIDVVGPANLETFAKTIPPYWSAKALYREIGDPGTEKGLAHLRATSPFNKADRIRAPLFVVQGAKDVRVPQGESDRLVAKLQGSSTHVTYALYPDEGHGISRRGNELTYLSITENFLALHLGGRHEPLNPLFFRDSSLQVPAGRQWIPGLGDILKP
jgi:dipeptidyl aminopeptidase/acylaminoacyl peptidase